MSSWDSFNSRYVAYCKAHGEDNPETMLEKDAERYPGGKMVGFNLWIQHKIFTWKTLQNYPKDNAGRYLVFTGEDHNAFDAWLQGEGNML